MNKHIIETAITTSDNINLTAPEFRNTSKNMAMAHAVLNKIFLQHNGLLDFLEQNTTGIFVGTSHGELEFSKNFLRSIALDGLARPILFQNSLHNSIVGFVTKTYGLTGPSFTVSNQYFSGEDALNLACDILDSQIIQYALVIGVDSVPAGIENLFQSIYGKDVSLTDGAGALLLTNEKNLPAISSYTRSIATLRSIKYNKTLSNNSLDVFDKGGYYDSNAIQQLVEGIQLGNSIVRIAKPNGLSSTIYLEY